MTMAKALGNGTPISAFIAEKEIADIYVKPGASTLGGNPVSSAAALAVLDYIERERLAEKARERGEQLVKGLEEISKRHRVIGDIRGLGLMIGAEFVRPGKIPADKELDITLEKMKDRGFIIGKNGLYRNVMAFQPPLVISTGDINNLLNSLEDVLKEENL